jgi:hypothetical protein
MKTSCVAVICLVVALSCGARAQETAPSPTAQPPPSPPLLAPHLPDWCQWTVDYTYPPGDPEKMHADRMAAYNKLADQDPTVARAMSNPEFAFLLDEPRPVHVTVVKTGDISHEDRTLERGFEWERWTIGDTMVDKLPESPKLDVHIEGLDPVDQFPEFQWISVANFKEREKLQGVDCLVFQQTLNPLEISHPKQFGADKRNHPDKLSPGTFVEVTAVVADATRLPVALEMATESRRYTFLAPPTAMLVPPAPFASAAQELKARLDAAIKPLSPP